MSHIRQCTCKLGHESRNAKVIVHVVRCGGEPFECGESTTNARGERNDTARYGERNEKNRQGTRKQCFPMVPTRFRHFCTFETNTQANERTEKKTERHCHVNLFIDSFRCQMMFAMSLVPNKGKQSSKSRC